ncbi:MAG: hypothetical protein ABIK21_03255 [bacterium]
MLKEFISIVGGISGLVSLIAILIFWFYKFGYYASKVDMLCEIVIKNISFDLAGSNPASQKFFSALSLKKRKYIEKISAKKESLEWKVSTIIGTMGLSKIKKWSGQTDALTIIKCLIVIINKYSPSSNLSKK